MYSHNDRFCMSSYARGSLCVSMVPSMFRTLSLTSFATIHDGDIRPEVNPLPKISGFVKVGDEPNMCLLKIQEICLHLPFHDVESRAYEREWAPDFPYICYF